MYSTDSWNVSVFYEMTEGVQQIILNYMDCHLVVNALASE